MTKDIEESFHGQRGSLAVLRRTLAHLSRPEAHSDSTLQIPHDPAVWPRVSYLTNLSAPGYLFQRSKSVALTPPRACDYHIHLMGLCLILLAATPIERLPVSGH